MPANRHLNVTGPTKLHNYTQNEENTCSVYFLALEIHQGVPLESELEKKNKRLLGHRFSQQLSYVSDQNTAFFSFKLHKFKKEMTETRLRNCFLLSKI